MPSGRLTDYSEKMVSKARKYLTEYEELGHEVPSAAGLACVLHVSRSTIYLWAEKYPTFSDILHAINVTQEQQCLAKGLNGQWNSNIVKLLLGKHGYHDKQDIDATVKDYRVIPADEGAIDDDD